MEKEIVLAFLGALTAVATAAGALIKYWGNKKIQVIDHEKLAKIEVIRKIEDSLQTLELQTTIAMNKVSEFEHYVKRVTNSFEENRKQLGKITESLKDIIS